VNPYVHLDAGHTNGCASMSSVSYVKGNCLCQPYGKQLNSVAAAYHICTILDTVAKLPFHIVLCAVLCCAVLCCAV